MAVTRINNNQISDASAGNIYVGINAAVKLQNYSVTATKIANNLTYGSDLTVTGNLIVQGNTTTIDTTYTTIEDPVILLASNQTGSPSVDIGFIGQRGNNIAFVWDESAKEFVTVYTATGETNTTINIASYADLHMGNANIGGNTVINGTTSLVGNLIGAVNVTGNITTGNLLTPGQVSATGNITSTANVAGGNINTGGQVSATANITGGNLITSGLITATGNITSTANVTGGNLLTSGLISATGNISSAGNITASYYFGNGSQLTGVSANTSGFPVSAGTSNINAVSGGNIFVSIGGTPNVVVWATTGEYVNGLVSVTGNVRAGNVVVPGGNVDVINFINAGAVITTGLIQAGTTMSAAGNITGANINTGGLVTATGNITSTANVAGGNIIATTTVSAASVLGSVVSALGNVTGGNLITSGLVTATGNITSSANVAGGNLVATTAVVTPTVTGTTVTISSTGGLITLAPSSNVSVSSKNINNLAQPVQDQDAATKLYVDNMVSTQLAYHQGVFAATTGTLETATGGTITYAQPNGAGNGVGATLTVAGGTFNLIDTANIQTANTRVLVKNQANAALNGVYIWSNATILTRSTDTDEYGANSSEQLSVNDYFFVSSGNVNAGSAWIVDSPSGTITFGTSNISFAQFSSSQTYTANTQAGILFTGTVISAKVDNNTTAFDGGGNIIVKAGANLTTPNIGAATGTSLSVTGNLTGAGANISGNVTGGNLITSGLVTASGNITGGNITTAGLVTATGNITSSANVTGGNITTAGLVTATGNITSSANVAGGNVIATTTVSAASVLGSVVSASGNVTGGNLITSGLVTATGNITSTANVAGGNVIATTAISAPTITGTTVSASGNVTGGNLITGGLITATGNITSTANVTGGNITTAGLITATGNITSTANVIGGNVITSGIVSATGNINGGNVNTTSVIGTTVSMSGNITGANLNTGGANGLTLNASTINSNAGRITINSNGSDVDFAVDSDATANVFYVDAGTGTVSIGSSTQTTNAALAINTTNSFLMPVGNTAQRPAVGVTGMLRFNSTLDAVEVYDTDSWSTVGTPSFTVVTDDQFTGNGVQTIYTLANAYTTNSVIVSINGVVQIPTTSYSVSGNSLTFTEAPQQGDFIDVRGLTTTTQVTSISNSPGNAVVSVDPMLNEVDITGNLLPVANNVQSLGSQTLRWKDLYVAGNSIYIGNIVMKNTSGNTVAFYGPDGTTPATLDSTNVDTTTIANGTSNVTVASSGGNVRVNVGGTSNVMVVNSTGVEITGNLSVTGNATLSGNILGDRVQNGTTSFDIQTQNGNANVSVSGTSNVAVFASTGLYVTGVTSATGNITSAGNISGAFLLGNASFVTGLSASKIFNGTTEANIGTSSGNANISVGGTSNVAVFASTGLFVTGVVSATGNITSTANVTGGNITTAGLITATGAITGAALTGTSLTVSTGNVTLGNIVNAGANGVGNIGSATTYFNTVFAKATSAQYADLAENYTADAHYEPGTVLSFGGTAEVTISIVSGDSRIAGVVSTNPSYIMNSTLESENVVTIALTGRVPTKVTGAVRKGDMMVSDGTGRAMACATPAMGTVIGKALENNEGGNAVIEVVVGRL
jgi:hypothetical protein